MDHLIQADFYFECDTSIFFLIMILINMLKIHILISSGIDVETTTNF